MTDHPEEWALLRLHLSAPPSQSSFQRLLAFLDTWAPGTDKEQAIDYADSHLASWDPRLRHIALSSLWPDYPLSSPPAQAQLVQSLSCPLTILSDPTFATALQDHLHQLQAVSIAIQFETDIEQPSPIYEEIHYLTITGRPFGDTIIEELLRRGIFPTLRGLDLSGNYIGRSQTLEYFAQTPILAALESLDLRYNQIDAAGIKTLIEGFSTHLRQLQLSHNPLSWKALRDICTAPQCQGLEELSLSSCQLTRQHSQQKKSLPTMPRLRRLRLSHNHLTQRELRALAPSETMPQLESLFLTANQLTDREAIWLATQLPLMQHLQHLCISHNRIGINGLEALHTASFQHPSLRRLDLISNPGTLPLMRKHLLSQLLAFSF